jgi:hypothetical protein
MKIFPTLAALLTFIFCLPVSGPAQQKKAPVINLQTLIMRTTSRHEVHRLGYGGAVTVIGAPTGSITIEGWQRNEVDISAEIQLQAPTEKDLDMLALVNTFVVDEDVNHLRIMSTGTHDKVFMKTVAKKFPKALIGMPWRIDYRIRVPMVLDLDVNAGRGSVSISEIEGNARFNVQEGKTDIRMSGGTLSGTTAFGNVNLDVPVRSWRGVGADFRVVNGNITVTLPAGFSADFDQQILSAGKIENSYEGLTTRQTAGQTSQQTKLRAGAGGPMFSLTVVNGTIAIKQRTANSRQPTANSRQQSAAAMSYGSHE